MKCCVSTDVGTWTNWLTSEPDLDYSPDAGTGLFSPLSYKPCCAEFYVGENPTYNRICIGRCSDEWFYNDFIHWGSELLKQLCRRYMRSTECSSSFIVNVLMPNTDDKSQLWLCICFQCLRVCNTGFWEDCCINRLADSPAWWLLWSNW